MKDDSLFKLISQFRNHYRLKASRKLHHATHSAFSAGQNSPQQGADGDQQNNPSSGGRGRGGATFRSKGMMTECPCGVMHLWRECYYLNPIIRPTSWKTVPETKKRVDEAMKNEAFRNSVEKSVKRFNERKKNSEKPFFSGNSNTLSKSTAFVVNDQNDDDYYGAFPVQSSSYQHYPLLSSWIYDNGSDSHICNKTMRHRFRKTRNASAEVIAEEAKSKVEAFGEVDIVVDAPGGETWKITLKDVCYIPNFMTNIVAARKFRAKGVYFDERRMRLHNDNRIFGWIKHLYDHDVLENNIGRVFFTPEVKNEEVTAVFSSRSKGAPGKSATVGHWHEVMAHAGGEVIQHLKSAAEGMKITDRRAKTPKTHECEVCALSKMHRIISHSHEREETSTEPFFRISYDFIAMNRALNGHEWVSHFACTVHDFNIVYTHRQKGEAQEIVRRAVNLIKTRFNKTVAFFRTDGEKSLGGDFHAFIKSLGITYEPSAPDTPAQNGHSEKKGHLLSMKARALSISANLPAYMWPWAFQTAGYLMNRTPMKKHEWKTPHENILGKKPHLGHLRKFGAKAYALDKTLEKKDRKNKMAPRAHIGFLVGYDSKNIFLIWIPSQRKVVRTRDVLFDEESRYERGEVDIFQLISEPMIETAFDVSMLPTSAVVEELDSDEDESVSEKPQNRPIESIEPSDQHKGKGKEVEAIAETYLSSPSQTPIDENSDENFGSSRTGHILGPEREENPVSPVIPETSKNPPSSSSGGARRRLAPFAPSASAPRDISARVDESNIISEGVKRKKVRKEAYMAALERVGDGGDEAFHEAFSAHLNSNQYYHQAEKNSPPQHKTSEAIKFHRDSLPDEPRHYRDLKNHPHAAGFRKAMEVEINALKAKNTWTEVPSQSVSENIISVPTTWAFKYKFDDQGYLTKYKARLCVRGDFQKTQRDTYAATLTARIFRVLIALVCAFDLETRQYDAINAFVNSEIDEAIYIRPPDGWTGEKNVLLLLLRALYGLKQSPALWYRHFSETLIEFGLNQVSGVECFFMNDYMLCFFFVDDIAVLYDRPHTAHVDEFQRRLFDRYEMRFIGELQWFLSIKIIRDRYKRTLFLSQESYIEKLVAKFNIPTNKASGSPLEEEHIRNSGTATKQKIYAYQQRVGSINYAAVITRPDIAFACSKLSEFLTNPSKIHLAAADRVIQYLAHTKHLSIKFDATVTNPQSIFMASSDAAFADDPDTRHSSHGYAFMLYNGLIDWKASKQRTVITSSTEAEFLAISSAGKELIWWGRFFEEISFWLPHNPIIQCDNRQTIRILTNPTTPYTTKLRHVDVHRHWLIQEIKHQKIKILWVPTAEILADGFTKALVPQNHKKFLLLIGLEGHGEKMKKGAGIEVNSEVENDQID